MNIHTLPFSIPFYRRGILAGIGVAAVLPVFASLAQDKPSTFPQLLAPSRAPVLPSSFVTRQGWPVYEIARALFRQKKFSDLHSLAVKVENARSFDRSARADLQDIFLALEAEAPRRPDGWSAYLKQFDDWIAATPDSPTAHVAKARAWLDYAWTARGSDEAYTVTSEGWRLFHERVATARAALEESVNFSRLSPHWYASMVRVAMAQGWPREATAALADEGIARAPWYPPTYEAMVSYLMPRWHGKPGDWQLFARAAVVHADKSQRAFLYSQLVSFAADYGEELHFTPWPVDWPLAREGCEQAAQQYEDPKLWKKFGLLCCLAGDREKAREVFGRISFADDFQPWRNEGDVAAWKAWAEGGELPAPQARREKIFEIWKALERKRTQAASPSAA